ncbi:trans-4-hydroxy-L-proline dehydratase activase [Merdimonas faecis]|uniref:trans-4-hydroxy-L-proline dehydratase activase n=1 Tax=Merdimonas faecis TaxID=1653435 RepID=UPI003A7F23B0
MEMKNITNIQKFSIHDGDGIRTTVFFKGCPLKCEWCHNPETQRFEKEMQVDREKCTGCGTCASVCLNGAVRMTEDHRPSWDPKACTFCGKCENFCPAGVREIVGREYTVKELTKELMKDQMFYEESGGGVTFSGGEVMSMDMDFILAMAKELKRQDVTLTIDTCGYVPYERFEKILPYVNTFLYDVKVMDPELHKKYMGTDNKLILENLIRLSQDGARIYIRIPTIKEVNGNEENMKETIAFLKQHDIHPAGVNLLPYHDTGSGKYAKLDMEYKGTDLHAPDKEEMEALAAFFVNAGFTNTKIGG